MNFFSIALIFTLLTLTGCGGGGGGDIATPQAPATVIGLFNTEQPIASGEVTLKDAEGKVLTTYTDINGVYYFDTSELTPPFAIKGSYVRDSQASSYYSYVDGEFSSTDNVTANISEFTSLATSLLVSQSGYGADPATLYTESQSIRTVIFSQDNNQALEAIIEFLCPLVMTGDGENSQQACSIDAENNFINTPYSADPSVDDVEKLNQLVNFSIDANSEEVQIEDSSGNTILTLSIADILDSTVADNPISAEMAIEVNDNLGEFEKKAPYVNEASASGLSSSGAVTGVVEYVANYYGADVIIDNLVECPIEIRDFSVTLSDDNDNDVSDYNASDYPTPYVGYPDPINVFNIDTSPEIKVNTPSARIHPIDECKSFKFKYQFKYNLVIRKEKFYDPTTESSVWKYDYPACEAYSIKAVEEYYQNIAVPADSFSNAVIEVRPELLLFPGIWPNNDEVEWIYSSECPIVADFSVSQTDGIVPLTVDVNGKNSAGNITHYNWSTSTGLTSSSVTPSFTFDTVGTHSITLTITDSNENTETVTKNITVADLPQAAFTWHNSTSSLGIDLDASSSTGTDERSYQWITSEGETSTGPTASLNFSSAGNHTVTLTLTDKYGNTSTVTEAVTAEEVTSNNNFLGAEKITCWTSSDTNSFYHISEGTALECIGKNKDGDKIFLLEEEIGMSRTFSGYTKDDKITRQFLTTYHNDDEGYDTLNYFEAKNSISNTYTLKREFHEYSRYLEVESGKRSSYTVPWVGAKVISLYEWSNLLYHNESCTSRDRVIQHFNDNGDGNTVDDTCPYEISPDFTLRIHTITEEDMWLLNNEYEKYLVN